MKSLLSILCVASVYSSRPVDIRIPITLDHNERLVASVTVPMAERSISNMVLTLHDDSVVTTNRSSGNAGPVYMLLNGSREGSSVAHRVEGVDLAFMPQIDGREDSYLGIGSGSAITQSSGSVSVLKYEDRAQLVLGSSSELFNSSCRPGSLMTWNLTEIVSGQESLVRFSGVVMGSYRGRFILMQTRHGSRAVIPVNIFTNLINLIIQTGAVLVSSERNRIAFFRNCTREMFETLPTVEIGFGQNQIVLLPQDYLEIDESRGTCKTRITPTLAPLVLVNPLMLVDTNVRINDNHLIDLCDSNGYF